MNLRLATLQRLLLMAAIALAIVYFGALRPLAERVADQEAPLKQLRQAVSDAMVEAGLPRGTDFQRVEERLISLQGASARFADAERTARPRIELPVEIRARLDEPFQLVEFLNESQRRLEELAALAQASRVTITPGLPRGFPRYQPELARPELLWVQLATVNRVLRTAIRAGVREILEVSVESLPLQDPPELGPLLPGLQPAPRPAPEAWVSLRVHLTTVGNMDALGRLLMALALTPEEVKTAGLAEDLAARPALFLDHFLVRRHQLDAAEQVQLELVVCTVVPQSPP
ncbi:MAG: hypothetical protein IT580_19480 [Verrucomicrobiales bacterium]|nr:hypothetical protein [Verrucomicrobiales bacterium]